MKKFFTGIALFLILCLPVSAQTLIPGGMLIGIRLENDTVTVTDTTEKSDLRPGDQLLTIDDIPIRTPEDIRTALAQSKDTVTVTILRGGKTKTLTLRPTVTSDGKKLGITLRSGVSGLGTVTYYDPDTGHFGALGHCVSGSDGQPVCLRSGSIYPAEVFSVTKGIVGKPGQLLGQLKAADTIGQVEKNVTRGIFGKGKFSPDQPLPVASRADAHTGKATIRCTVSDAGLQEYSVEILRIYPESTDRTRDLLLRVTDETLLSITGGIVQGMSGSPIIQDGKLIGAVTHVLVNDPTMGYGILMENMLSAAA